MKDSDPCTLFLSALLQPYHHSEGPGLVNFFIVSTTNNLCCSFIYSFLHSFHIHHLGSVSFTPLVSSIPPPLLSPPQTCPLLSHPPLRPIAADRPGGTGTEAGLRSQNPRQRPRLRKRAAGLQGSSRRRRLRGASCHAGPAYTAPALLLRGPRVRRRGPGERADYRRDVQLE